MGWFRLRERVECDTPTLGWVVAEAGLYRHADLDRRLGHDVMLELAAAGVLVSVAVPPILPHTLPPPPAP